MNEQKAQVYAPFHLRPRVICRHGSPVDGRLPLGYASCAHALSTPSAERIRLDPIDDGSPRGRSYGLLLCPSCAEAKAPATIYVCEHDADAAP